ncbi:hypothetical protein [Petrimonas sulfuriphila]|uniref:hypothetical protein n=1 Tax=Petrimonas sulfuriphila TaxID=285070 RepID=UPI003EB7B306
MNVDFDKIDGLNDRRNLLLMLYKESKIPDDESKIAILSTLYPDAANKYVREIHDDLFSRGFIDIKGKNHDVTPFDNDYNSNACWVTTESGLKALEVNFFPSEIKKKNEERKRQEKKDKETDLNIQSLKMSKLAIWISVIAIIISAIALLSQLGLIRRWLPHLMQ